MAPEVEPTWEELRSRSYCKLAAHSELGITHSLAWEDSKTLRTHTLRVSEYFIRYLDKKKGRKRRLSSRVVGKTPDDSFIQQGQRANGRQHQLRGEMNALFACEQSFIQKMLVEFYDYKPLKKVRVNLKMPNLRTAVDEVYRAMIVQNPELRHHPAFKRMWAPAICRLIEIKWHKTMQQKKLHSKENS